MRPDEILECPECRTPLSGTDFLDCRCGGYPVVAGIPIVTAWAKGRRFTLEEVLARHLGVAHGIVEKIARRLRPPTSRLRRAVTDSNATFLSLAADLGRGRDLDYFRYRFSDLTYIAGCALLAAVPEGPVIDVGCGAAHFERALARRVPPSDIVGVDLNFTLLYLARRFVAPECRFVCADGASRLPFRDGAFRSLLCIDAFNLFPSGVRRPASAEFLRVASGPLFLAQLWHPSSPQAGFPAPLDPARYREMFQARSPRLYSQRAILSGFLRQRVLDLTESPLEPGVMTLTCRVEPRRYEDADFFVGGENLRWNPIYDVVRRDWRLHLKRRTLSEDHARLCREFDVLPEEVFTHEGDRSAELIRKFVLLDLPPGYADPAGDRSSG